MDNPIVVLGRKKPEVLMGLVEQIQEAFHGAGPNVPCVTSGTRNRTRNSKGIEGEQSLNI